MSDPAKMEIKYDASTRRLYWTMRGFWTLQDVYAFAAGLRDAVMALGPPPQSFDGLCDSCGFPVQSLEVSQALGEIERLAATMRRGRFAIVVGSMMNKFQAQRTLVGDDVRVFLSMEEAEAWLQQPQQTDHP